MRLQSGIIVLVLCLSSVIGADEPSKPKTTETPFSTESTESTVVSTTIKTTESPSTTTVASTAPTAITESTVSPTAKTTVTEPTVAPPVTTPEPKSHIGNWTVYDAAENRTCIRAVMAVQFIFANSSQYLSSSANTTGSQCGNTTELLVLSDDKFSLTLIFQKDKSGIYVSNISLTTSGETKEIGGKYFPVTETKSYKCEADINEKVGDVTVQFSHAQLQAFMNGAKFADASICEEDKEMNDIVPIAVACALAAMVVIILVSYLVARRQSRQRGYESV